jgi:hypothetical protein
MLAMNGASLFGHSLTFFPVGARTTVNAVPSTSRGTTFSQPMSGSLKTTGG